MFTVTCDLMNSRNFVFRSASATVKVSLPPRPILMLPFQAWQMPLSQRCDLRFRLFIDHRHRIIAAKSSPWLALFCPPSTLMPILSVQSPIPRFAALAAATSVP